MNKFFTCILISVAVLSAQDTGMVLVKRSALPPAVLQQVDMAQKIENYGQWVGLGKEIGTAVKEGLSALTDEADKFSKTNVGKFTMFMIAFKILGYPIIQFFVGMFLCLVFIPMFIISYTKHCLPHKFLRSEKDGKKEYGIREPDGDTVLAHVAAFFVFVLLDLAIIFVH